VVLSLVAGAVGGPEDAGPRAGQDDAAARLRLARHWADEALAAL